MPYCKVCLNPRSPFIFNNKVVCMHCDELLFDIEIESEDYEVEKRPTPAKDRPAAPVLRRVKATK